MARTIAATIARKTPAAAQREAESSLKYKIYLVTEEEHEFSVYAQDPAGGNPSTY